MQDDRISVRELTEPDIDLVLDYWYGSSAEHLQKMGASKALLPKRAEFRFLLSSQLLLPLEKRRAYSIIWELNGGPVGHCNTNPFSFGDSGFMHLHMWNGEIRRQGLGLEMLKLSLAFFFEKLRLKELFCEPYALNPAPNRTLEKAGFQFVKEYVTVPGGICFEQSVKQWQMSAQHFSELRAAKG